MANQSDVHAALLAKIHQMVQATNSASTLLKLAEAYAWAVNPNQPHGGHTESK